MLLDPLALAQRGERSHLGGGVLRVADADGFGLAFQAGEKCVLDGPLDQQPRAGDAALAGGGKDAGDDGVGGAVEIGIGEDHDRRLLPPSSSVV